MTRAALLRAEPRSAGPRRRAFTSAAAFGAALVACVLLSGCDRASSSTIPASNSAPAGRTDAAPGRLQVVVSIRPQAYLVRKIAGEDAHVEVLIGPAQSHHTYEPTPQQLLRIGRATLYFRIGLSFENSLSGKLAGLFPHLRIVDSQQGVPLLQMTAHCDDEEHHALRGQSDDSDHAHESGAEHGASQPDPHIWLDPQRSKIMAANICAALCDLSPGRADVFRRNLAALAAELDQLDAELSRLLAPLKGQAFIVFHPAYGYFADRYGLRQVPVEVEGRSPSARELAQLIERARQERARAIFVQPQFGRSACTTIAQSIGAVVIELDPLAEDYAVNLRGMAERLAAHAGTSPLAASPGEKR